MESPKGLRPSDSARLALSYADKFDYPLKVKEIWLWQPYTSYSLKKFTHLTCSRGEYCFLKNRSHLPLIRSQRERASIPKLQKAASVARFVRFVPGVKAVFISGALAMRNSPENDDIDLFIIVSSGFLWSARALVVLLLRLLNLRRPVHLSEHSSPLVKDKICDNLYLDMDHLQIPHYRIAVSRGELSRNFFLSHEILQAECLFDRGGVHESFLKANSWVGRYLPVAYRQAVRRVGLVEAAKVGNSYSVLGYVLFIVNLLIFIPQYLHMRPRMTSEKVGLGFAFFHPGPPVVI